MRLLLYMLYAFIEQSKRTMSANWNEGSIATPDDLVDQLVRDPSGSGRSESLTVRRNLLPIAARLAPGRGGFLF